MVEGMAMGKSGSLKKEFLRCGFVLLSQQEQLFQCIQFDMPNRLKIVKLWILSYYATVMHSD